MKVDVESSKLLTFLTLFTRPQFKHLPFWIHSASKVFKQDIDEVIRSSESEKNIQDDIIMWELTLNQLNIHTASFKQNSKVRIETKYRQVRLFSNRSNVVGTHNIRKVLKIQKILGQSKTSFSQI